MGRVNENSDQDLWKNLRCRRAVSPILATLLLIVIVVAAGIAAYAWIQSSTTAQMTQASGFIIIENARFYDGNNVELIIRNTGTANLAIDTVYIDGVGHPAEQNVQAGESATVVIDYSWEIGTRCKKKWLAPRVSSQKEHTLHPPNLKCGMTSLG